MSHRAHDVSLEERMRMSFGGGPWRSCAPGGPGPGGSGRCCEKCSAALVSLKKQALSLAVHHHFSCQDTSDLSVFLHEHIRVHSRLNTESRDRDRELGQCGSCGTNPDQLKQEAIHLALSRGHSLAKPLFEASLGAGAVLGQSETKRGDTVSGDTGHQPHSPRAPQSPRTPQRTPHTLRRRGPKLPKPDMDRWVEEQQQLVSSKSGSSADGVTLHSYHKAADGATLSRGDTGMLQTSSKISRVVTIANTAAMSLLARAAEKLNMTLRKKDQTSDPAPSNLSTCFREIIQKNPPPVPSCLLQAAARTKDSPDVLKVKVVLRVSRLLSESQCQPPVLRIDPSKKRVTIMEPVTKNLPHSTLTLGRESKSPLKTFNFDTAYSQDSGQAEVCAGILSDVIRCVLSGSDGCLLGLGYADVGSWSSMVGSSENIQKLGLIPCAISWLYSAIERRRERTWTDLTVSVSAIELCCGEEDTLRDLLGEVGPSSGSIQNSPKAHIRVQEDSICGIQIRNHNRVKAPTVERAASLLDAAIAARRHTDFVTYLCNSSIMFFTLYIQPPRTESNTIGKGSRGTTKLTMIDVCSGMRGVSKNASPHSELGPIVLSLLSGHKFVPSKASKLSLLLRESMAHPNCHIAVIAQVADSLAQLHESFSTIQLASRIRRTQKRTKQSASCSPCGRSLTKEKRGPQSLSLRAFHSTEEVDVDFRPFCLRGQMDRSSSDQSCDTVIQINSDGSAHSKGAPVLTQPKFLPIIPSLHPSKADMDDPEFAALLEELLRIPQPHREKKAEESVQLDVEALKAEQKQPERDCLKCDTFAELQERLGCIDGSEVTMDVLKSSFKGASLKNNFIKSEHQKEASKAPQTLLNMGMTQIDGAHLGDGIQREDSGLFDCEECSATSSSEELLNQALGLSMTCRSELPNNRPIKSSNNFPSKGFSGDSQGKTATSSSALQPSEKQEGRESADWLKSDKRASPVGKSSPISPASTCSSSQPLVKSVRIGDVLPNCTTEDVKEMKATITVTVQQPLDQMGQDELVFSMVEEVTISGAYDRGNTSGNIICFRDHVQPQAHGQSSACSQPIRIIGDVSDDCSAAASSIGQSVGTDANNEKSQNQFKIDKGLLPSFINPMLINTDMDCGLNGDKEKDTPWKNFKDMKLEPEPKMNIVKYQEGKNNTEKQNKTLTSETDHVKKSCKVYYPSCTQDSSEAAVLKDKGYCKKSGENNMCEKRHENTDKDHPRQCEHVCSSNHQRVSEGGEITCSHVGNIPQRTGAAPGCQEIIPASCETANLSRGWQNSNHQDNHSREVTSSIPCSPRGTLERRPTAHHNVYTSSSSPKLMNKFKHDSSYSHRKVSGSIQASSPTGKHDSTSSRLKSPAEKSSRLFTSKLEQLASRTNSLGRTPSDFTTLERGNSNTSMSSKGSSMGSIEAGCKVRHKKHEGDCTFPRANRSPRRNPHSDHHFFHSENPVHQSSKSTRSKLSAVGKLKMGSPKVRRLSASSIKNLSQFNKSLQQSTRSASLSPDCKTVSFERTSSFFSSSPPLSYHSISRTPSQSSTCSSTKSAIQGFVNGRISDLLRDRSSSPTSTGSDQMTSLPSPYSQVTAPRLPDDLNGHASDTTSILSGDLPPAMGKTSLHFSNRSSIVSSGYGSMVRDSEAAGRSNRESVSDRSGSPLSVARSSRSSRRRGNTGSHQRHLSHDAPGLMKRSASSQRSRWMDQGIPEAYDIKVYEIDNVQRLQKRAGPCMLQRQAAVFGTALAEDLRGPCQMQQPEERGGVGPTQPHAGDGQMDPRGYLFGERETRKEY